MIKRTMAALALALGMTTTLALATPEKAEAGDHFRAGVSITYQHRHCNACQPVVRYERQWVPAVYQTQRVFVGYDYCGNPVFQHRRVCVREGFYQNVPVTYFVCGGGQQRTRSRSGFSFRFRF